MEKKVPVTLGKKTYLWLTFEQGCIGKVESVVVDSREGRPSLVFVVSCFHFKLRRSELEGRLGMRRYPTLSTETERRRLLGRFHVSNGET